MENYYLDIETLNNESNRYTLENTTIEAIYSKLNNSPDGWIEFLVRGETHYISADKVVRVKITPKSVTKERQENTAKAAQNFFK